MNYAQPPILFYSKWTIFLNTKARLNQVLYLQPKALIHWYYFYNEKKNMYLKYQWIKRRQINTGHAQWELTRKIIDDSPYNLLLIVTHIPSPHMCFPPPWFQPASLYLHFHHHITSIFLPLSDKDPGDYIGPTQIILDNIPISRSLT